MGTSVQFHCDQCGYDDDVCLGVGMNFPMAYEETVKDLQDGKYGLKWKSLFDSFPHAKVNANRELYVCPSCGAWKADYNLSLYIPKQPDAKKDGTDHSIPGPDEKPNYVSPWELTRNWSFFRSYVHHCQVCNKRMHLARMGDQPTCPKCGNTGEFLPGTLLWD